MPINSKTRFTDDSRMPLLHRREEIDCIAEHKKCPKQRERDLHLLHNLVRPLESIWPGVRRRLFLYWRHLRKLVQYVYCNTKVGFLFEDLKHNWKSYFLVNSLALYQMLKRHFNRDSIKSHVSDTEAKRHPGFEGRVSYTKRKEIFFTVLGVSAYHSPDIIELFPYYCLNT